MNILILDDDSRILEFLKRGLEAETHTVSTATSPCQGWQHLESKLYDMVIVDVFLGEANGLDFCRELREKHHRLPVLVMTAKDSAEILHESQCAGANAYLPKPFSFDDLVSTIKELEEHHPSPNLPPFSNIPALAMSVHNFSLGLFFWKMVV